MPSRNLFIDIEGLDGSGSSTQASLLSEYLNQKSLKTIATKEPTDNVIGGLIRGTLTGTISDMPPTALQLLFVADRLHHLHKFILPALEVSNVITDRYLWSTVAFGGISIDRDWLLDIQKDVQLPDLTFFIKLDPEECVKRIHKNRFDIELFEKVDKLTKAWENYLWLKEKFPEKIFIIDGHQEKQKVLEDIVKVLENYT
ncbi:dTMP kinase [bacterium]|nr:MAG: dTMP kinase [bacterium]